jgi:hypothetical protein
MQDCNMAANVSVVTAMDRKAKHLNRIAAWPVLIALRPVVLGMSFSSYFYAIFMIKP